MTLRLRLLFSALVLSLATTFVLALVVRSAWQDAEESRFEDEFQATVERLKVDLSSTAPTIAARLDDVCDHDPIVDSALIGFASGGFDANQQGDDGRLLSLRARVPGLQASLRLDELMLVTSEGQVLAGTPAEEGDALAARAETRREHPGFRSAGPPAFEAACVKKEGKKWVALLGAVHLAPLLEQAGQSQGLELALLNQSETKSYDDTQILHREIAFPFLSGAKIEATRSRRPLRSALRSLNIQVATAAAGTLTGALLLALLLSRGLARPVVQFAERTRQVLRGNVQSLPLSGGPELEQAARAFNATLEDLRDLRERLVLTERIAARREVARQIAHEIKNPLSPIRTSIESLRKLKERDHPQFDELFDETTNTVLHEVRRIANLVNHFSEYARLPSPVAEEFELGKLLEEVTRLHQDLGASVELRQSKVGKISADRDQISQVLTNLIKNALEATREVPDPKVRIACRELPGSEGSWIEVAVTDNGSGVPASQLEKLFEPYATTKKDGTGLGLPISQRIAIEHGGDLTYTTLTNGGACFVLLLPTFGPPTLSDES